MLHLWCPSYKAGSVIPVKMLEASSALRFVGHSELKSDNTANLNRDLYNHFRKERHISSKKRQCHSTGALRPLIFIIKDNYVTFTSTLPALWREVAKANLMFLNCLLCTAYSLLGLIGQAASLWYYLFLRQTHNAPICSTQKPNLNYTKRWLHRISFA